MSLEERLAQMREAEAFNQKEQARREREQQSKEVSGQIQTLSTERDQLEQMRESLSAAYGRFNEARTTTRSQRETIEAIIAKNRDILASTGITKARELAKSPDFEEESEVASYNASRSALQETGRVTGEAIKTARESLAIDRPDDSESPTATSGKTVRERIFNAIQDRIAALDAQIQDLEIQTPEGREAQERRAEAHRRVEMRSRPRFGDSRESSVMPEDLADAEELGEDEVRAGIVRHYEKDIDQMLESRRRDDGMMDFEHDLAALEENRRAYEEAVQNFKTMKEHYREALAHLEQFQQISGQGWDAPGVREQNALVRLVAQRLDHPIILSIEKGSIPRSYADYLKDGATTPFPVVPSKMDGYYEEARNPNAFSRTIRKIEDFRATAEQIKQVDNLLREVLEMSDLELNFQIQHSRAEKPPTSYEQTVKLRPRTADMLTRNNVDALREKVEKRHQVDDEEAKRLKATLPKSVARDWKEQTYQVFENDPRNKEVVRRLEARERNLPVAVEVVRMIDALRSQITGNQDASVTISRGWSEPRLSLYNSKQVGDRYEAWQGAVKNNRDVSEALQRQRDNLHFAKGITKFNERKRITAEIARLEESFVGDAELTRLHAKYEKEEKNRVALQESLNDLVRKVDSGSSGREALRLDSWLDGLDARYRPVLETEVSEEDQAILDRHRALTEERGYGYRW